MTNQLHSEGGNRLDATLYESHVALWIHQDELQWSRVNWIIAIQGAALAGFFARPNLLGILAIVLGTVLLLLLAGMYAKDGEDRARVWKVMDRFHEENGLPGHRILARPVRWRPSAGGLLRVALVLILVVNVLLVLVAAVEPMGEWVGLNR